MKIKIKKIFAARSLPLKVCAKKILERRGMWNAAITDEMEMSLNDIYEIAGTDAAFDALQLLEMRAIMPLLISICESVLPRWEIVYPECKVPHAALKWKKKFVDGECDEKAMLYELGQCYHELRELHELTKETEYRANDVQWIGLAFVAVTGGMTHYYTVKSGEMEQFHKNEILMCEFIARNLNNC